MKIYRLSDNLKFLREDCGLTREQLADDIGASASSIRRWEESDCIKAPNVLWAMEIARYFCVSLDELVYGDLRFE